MTALAPVLDRLGISQYLEAFIAEGFDTWETLLDVTEEDLDALNVKRGHRRKLQREIANARGVSLNRPLRLPSPPSKPIGEEVGGELEKRSISPGNSGRGETSAKSGKRKYRRHPKPDEHAPEKPPSAYVIFSNRVRESMRGQNLSFAEMAKVVGHNWQALTAEHREKYEAEAAAAKQTYNERVAEYMKTDNFRNYMEYLADFRAKQGIQTADVKRRKPEAGGHPSRTEGGATTGAHTQAAERGSGGQIRTTSVDLAGMDSVSSGQPSPSGPAPSSLPWFLESRYPPANLHGSSRDMSIAQSPVSPTSSAILSVARRPSFSFSGRPSSRVEAFGDSSSWANYGRGPNPPSRMNSNDESHVLGPLVALPPPAAPLPSLRDTERFGEPSMAGLRPAPPTSDLSTRRMEDLRLTSRPLFAPPFADEHRGDAPARPSSPPNTILPPFKRPPTPHLPPFRVSPGARYAFPPFNTSVPSRGGPPQDMPRSHSIDGVTKHDVRPGLPTTRPESAPSQNPPKEDEHPPGAKGPPNDPSSQYPRPTTPISALLKASETISERSPKRRVDGES
ncbi:MAG: hypothetical protein M1816_005795 [Peltula sp. TS41687]|nr:MAG: hypothetical protein M1816_005795 [Peltula sp. TS41687]